jgi:hypothetical protein
MPETSAEPAVRAVALAALSETCGNQARECKRSAVRRTGSATCPCARPVVHMAFAVPPVRAVAASLFGREITLMIEAVARVAAPWPMSSRARVCCSYGCRQPPRVALHRRGFGCF